MKKVLVTGGLGYIGAHVALLLVKQGLEVVILDNVWHGNPNTVIGATHVLGDVGDENLLGQLFTDHYFDAVIHLAGFIQVGESVAHPKKYFENNVTNTLILLDQMVKHRCSFFVFSSTAAIFGDPKYTPINEQHPKNPLNPYGQYKLMIEQRLADYYTDQGIKFAALRYFNAAGCDSSYTIGELHQPETHLIPLILQVASGRANSIAIFGTEYPTPDGTCIRDYIHVSDLSNAHSLALNYLWGKGKSLLVNLGTGQGYSVKQVIDVAKEICKKNINVTVCPPRLGDSPILIADGTVAKNILGWRPEFSDIHTILTDAWQWEQKLKMNSLTNINPSPTRGEGLIGL